jgi:hypothetical protein
MPTLADMVVDMVTEGMATVDIAVKIATTSAVIKQALFPLIPSMISKISMVTAIKLNYASLCLQGETSQISSTQLTFHLKVLKTCLRGLQ